MSVHPVRTESEPRPRAGRNPFSQLAAEDPYAAVLDKLEPAERELLAVGLAGVGHHILDHSGDRIGKVHSVLVDRETGAPHWLAVHVRHRREALVGLPVAGISNAGGHLWTALDAQFVRNAPIVASERISARVEHALCRYYKLPLTRGASQGRWERRATCGQAFRDPETPALIRWLPGPRGHR